jgi:hypothetical protein
MPNYTDLMNLYLPSRSDSTIEIDVALAENFQKIDDSFKDLAGIFGVSVLQFGANPSGTVNTATQIQAAIDQASTSGLKKVYIPNGIYRIDTALNVPADFEVNAQNGAIIRRGVSGLTTLVNIGTKSSWTGGQFDQNSSFNTDCCNIKLADDAENVTISQTSHTNIVGDCIWLRGAKNAVIESNVFRGYRPQSGINCIFILVDRSSTTKKGCESVTITNNFSAPFTTEKCTSFISTVGTTTPPALADYNHRSFQVTNNNFRACSSYGLVIRGLAFSNISDNLLLETGDSTVYLRGYDTAEWVNASGTAITVGTLVTDNTVNGNILFMDSSSTLKYGLFVGQGQETISARNISASNNIVKYSGIQFDKVQNGTCFGNNISVATGASGFAFDACIGVACIGNSIDTAEYGIRNISSTSSLIAGNTIKQVDRHGIWSSGTSPYMTVTGNSMYDIGILANATYQGILLNSGTTYATITANRIYNGAVNKLQYGISLNSGANNNSYFGNKFTGSFATAYKLDSGTGNSESATNS